MYTFRGFSFCLLSPVKSNRQHYAVNVTTPTTRNNTEHLFAIVLISENPPPPPSQEGGPELGAIIGGTIGGIAGAAALAFLGVFIYSRCERKDEEEEMV